MSLMEGEYPETRRVAYGNDDKEYGTALFVPVCEKCGRYVRADKSIKLKNGHLLDAPNATCSNCGRTGMPFEGFL